MLSMNLSRIDLNLLLAFEALMQARSVSRAANTLGLRQPAMSAALARLRRLFGDELFVRTGGEMRPSPKALRLAPGILEALRHLRGPRPGSRLRPGHGYRRLHPGADRLRLGGPAA